MRKGTPSSKADSPYLEHLRSMLGRFYGIIRSYGLIAREQQAFIQGYMAAGRVQGSASREQLGQVMEAENQAVFGMSIEERRKTVPARVVSVHDEAYLDIPTVVRGTLKLD